LRAARNQTIHIEQVIPAHLARRYAVGRFHLRAESEPEAPQPPVTVPVQNDKMLWAFQALPITIAGGKLITTLQPPPDDVVRVCKNYIRTLEALIEAGKRARSSHTRGSLIFGSVARPSCPTGCRSLTPVPVLMRPLL